jgi:predicted nucleotidyltransferase
VRPTFRRPLAEVVRDHVPGVLALYLFGSCARGDGRPDSDLDLAVLLARPLAPLERWYAQEAIAAALGVDVDLVDLRTASTVMRVEVLRDAELLFDGSPSERALFEATALGAYARLAEERRGILEDVRERGHVYR